MKASKPAIPYAMVLPYPPSANAKYAGKYGKVLSEDARRYPVHVEAVVLRNGIKCAENPVNIVVFRFPKTRAGDGDNIEKVLFDALSAAGKLSKRKLVIRNDNTNHLVDHHNIFGECTPSAKVIVVVFDADDPSASDVILAGVNGVRGFGEVLELLRKSGIKTYR